MEQETKEARSPADSDMEPRKDVLNEKGQGGTPLPTCKKAFKRLYLDEERAHKPPPPPPIFATLRQHVHVLYGHWVAAGYHHRDFVEALSHAAVLCIVEYKCGALAGLQDVCALVLPKMASRDDVERALAQPAESRQRFYNAEGDVAIDMPMMRSVIWPLYVNWVVQGWHPMEFGEAVRNSGSGVVYDHSISQALGGLGGCKTALQYLTEPVSAGNGQ